MIRVAVLDDHPAVLAGLQRLVERSPGLAPSAAVHSPDALERELDAEPADVVVVDYDLARSDGLTVCQQLKQRARPPAVVVYSAYAGPALAVAARVAAADALVDKRAPVGELMEAIGRVAAGGTVFADVPRDVRESAFMRLAEEEVPVAAMLLGGASQQDVAEALGIDRRDVRHRVRRIVSRLRPKPAAFAAQMQPALHVAPAGAGR